MKKSDCKSQDKKSPAEAISLIGSMIKDCRKKKALSQSELAVMSNISLSTMRRIEAGTGTIPISIYLRVTQALNISLSNMVREAETDLQS